MRGLYIHVPFCASKCAYCDFYSLPGRLELVDPYIEAVLAEARRYAGIAIDTIYLGGGTPSLLGAAGLNNLVAGLRQHLDISRVTEATIEVNPESATTELMAAVMTCGINRLSVGVQSLSDRELKSVGRIHTAAQAVAVITQAKSMGFESISADVIVGLPGQSPETLRDTLGKLVELGIRHLSVYCLSLEQGTPLAMSPPSDLPSDDMQVELFHQAEVFLEGRGLIHYEISNFAFSGQECQHNLNYWRGGEYLGLGPAAASHLNGRRFRNDNNLDAYIKNPVGLTTDVEELGGAEKVAEEAMLRLRLLEEGASITELVKRFGTKNSERLISRLDRMVEEGVLILHGSRYRLPPSRVFTSNSIFARVLGD